MKTDQLMEAIENIDDRYIEESAYGVRRKSHIPWGLIATAACFCLAIGATIFMQSMGILPHLNGPSEATSQPTTPSTTETTIPQPTVALPTPEAVFGEFGSLHNRMLGYIVHGPEDVEFYFLVGKRELGTAVELTEQEEKLLEGKLKYGIDFSEIYRVKKEQLDDVFWSVYGLTWEQVIANFDPANYSGMSWMPYVPVYLEETGYYYGYCLDAADGIEIADIETQYCEDGTVNMFYTIRNTRYVAKLRVHETGYHILSNTVVEVYEELVDPEVLEEIKALFTDKNDWNYRALIDTFAAPTWLHLRYYFYNSTEFGEGLQPTKEEMDELMALQPDGGTPTLVILPVSKMDAILTDVFDITVAEMESAAFAGMKYVESIDSWCFWGIGRMNAPVDISIQDVQKGRGDYYNVFYTTDIGKYEMTVIPCEDGYTIYSNSFIEYTAPPFPDDPDETTEPTTPAEWEVYNELFKNWYNQALTSEYDSPEQIGLRSFFNCGFRGEPEVTDAEWAQLKNMQGFASPAGNIYRLSPDKMNPVLTECFGITLKDVDPTGFNGLAYLESTNCYYFKASAPNNIDFRADKVEEQSDGTIDIYYNVSYMGDYVVTIKPYGDSYRVLANRCVKDESPATPTEPTGDTELEILFAGYWKVSEKEATQKMVDAFLADPDTFVRLLAKQERDRAILGVLSRNVTDNHPQIDAYRTAVGNLLAKELPEKETLIVKGMAVYSGISNYFPDEPTTDDYAKLLDIMQYYSHEGESNELLRRYCIADPRGVIEQIVLTEIGSYSFYTERLTFLAPQEELEQIKESVTQRKEELSKMNGEDVQEQIKCAQMIIESCDEELQ